MSAAGRDEAKPCATEPVWTYWCPPEGTHTLDPNELHVGIVTVDDDGLGWPVLVAAIVPPICRLNRYEQAEAFARMMCEALKAGPWNEPDGFAAGLSADGNTVPFPRVLPGEETTTNDLASPAPAPLEGEKE